MDHDFVRYFPSHAGNSKEYKFFMHYAKTNTETLKI